MRARFYARGDEGFVPMSSAGTKRARRDLDAGSAPAAVCGASARTAAADDDSMARTRAMLARRLGPSPPRVACVSIEGRGRALVALAPVKKGETFLAERPLAATQAEANRARFLACAHCLSPAGDSVAHHLALASGLASRRELIAAALNPRHDRSRVRLPDLPSLSGDAADAVARGPVPCARGCGDVFCSPGCRDAAARWHALLCTGGCDEGDPIYEFRRHAMRSHESFLLAANALARALAEAGASDGVGDGEAGDANDADEDDEDDENRTTLASNAASTAAATLATLPTPAAPWWETAARANAPPSHPDAPPDVVAKASRRTARQSRALREQMEDAWQLLDMAWRIARGMRHERHLDALLRFDVFACVVAAVDDAVQPLGREHPGCAYARRAVRAEAATSRRACDALDESLRRTVEADVEADEEADDEEETRSSRDASEDDSDTDDDSDSDVFDSEGSDDDDDAAAASDSEGSEPAWVRRAAEAVRRGASATLTTNDRFPPAVPPKMEPGGALDVVERAAAALPRAAALALAPVVALANHSCVPNCQVEATRADDGDGDGVGCGSLRVSLVALRDVAAGEELTVAYVPVARSAEARADELASRYGFRCVCERCALERDWGAREGDREGVRAADAASPSRLAPRDLIRLADQAQEEARYEDAERAARVAVAADPSNGDAAHKIGVALLGQGRWAEAHAAWREGFASAPKHPALAAQAAKDEAYRPGVPRASRRDAESEPEPEPEASSSSATTTLHPAGVWSTPADRPVLTREECAAWIEAAEAAATARGGWTTSRHYAVPTTDLPVHEVPALLPRWNELMRGALGRFLAAACPEEVTRGGGNVRVHDAFVVRYDASAQHHLPFHADQSSVSVTLALNDGFEGGGTTFSAPVGVTARPETGHAVAFRGNLRHGGAPVTAGTRYIVAAFLFTE